MGFVVRLLVIVSTVAAVIVSGVLGRGGLAIALTVLAGVLADLLLTRRG